MILSRGFPVFRQLPPIPHRAATSTPNTIGCGGERVRGCTPRGCMLQQSGNQEKHSTGGGTSSTSPRGRGGWCCHLPGLHRQFLSQNFPHTLTQVAGGFTLCVDITTSPAVELAVSCCLFKQGISWREKESLGRCPAPYTQLRSPPGNFFRKTHGKGFPKKSCQVGSQLLNGE